MKLQKTVCLFGLLALSGALAQSPSAVGDLQGSVQDSQGPLLPGAQVRYRRVNQQVLVHGVMLPVPGEALAGGTVVADIAGAFSVANLPTGTYMLCASVPSAPYLDPCVSRQAIPATVSAEATATTAISLQKGVYLKVRISDPLHLLPQSVDGPLTPRKLQVGITYVNAAYQGAANVDVDATGRDYQLIIPAGTPFQLWLYSSSITLADTSGNPVATSGAGTAFQATAGQDQSFTFVVTGTQAQ